jgi:hypothetical protein
LPLALNASTLVFSITTLLYLSIIPLKSFSRGYRHQTWRHRGIYTFENDIGIAQTAFFPKIRRRFNHAIDRR